MGGCEMKLNDFQNSLIGNKDACWEVVKMFHPNIDDSKKDNLKVSSKYDWVMLDLGKKVSIGLKFECKLSNGNKPIELFEEERLNNRFRAWRFADDSLFRTDVDSEYTEFLNSILSKHSIKKPSTKQMYDYYHKY